VVKAQTEAAFRLEATNSRCEAIICRWRQQPLAFAPPAFGHHERINLVFLHHRRSLPIVWFCWWWMTQSGREFVTHLSRRGGRGSAISRK
jgi:hypothetical protein